MSLFDIKNKLYKKELDEDITRHEASEFDARIDSAGREDENPVRPDAWEEKKTWLTEEKKKMLKIGGIAVGIIVVIVLILVAIYQVRKASFNENRVTVSVDGSTQAASGKLLTYTIIYNNNNNASLNGAVLRITHPDSFKPDDSKDYHDESPTVSVADLNQVAGHGTGKIVFSGREYSLQGTLMYIKANLTYTPSDFNSQFQAAGQLGVNVVSTPVSIEVMGPQNLSSGDSLDYQISYKNEGESDFDNLEIKADYPAGFTFSHSDPPVSENNNVWYVGRLSAGAEGKIVVSGKLEGDVNQVKNIKVYVGAVNQGQFVSYNDESTSTKIILPPLAIGQTVNGLANLDVNAGDTLRFEINYKNQSVSGVTDAIVTEKLDSPVLDYSTLATDSGGAFDQSTNTITWKASDYPNLANLDPGQGGTIKFSIKVKDSIPVQSINDKNFIISSVAKIDSPDIQSTLASDKVISGNEMDLRLNSQIALDVKGYYTDPLISNSGPIPPTVGQTTSYTIHLKVSNVSNDVTGGQAVITLPTGVTFTGKTYPADNSSLTYNDRTNTVVWNIGDMKAGDGILNPPRETAFQISITPSANQSGSAVDLLDSAVFTAKDSFTGENLAAQGGKKTTMLTEDSTVGINGGKVQ